MPPTKRLRMDVEAEPSSKVKAFKAELQLMKMEIEPVENRRSSTMNATITYRPTYRADLARKGFLVRQTLGSGSYSKVKFAHYLSPDGERNRVAIKIIDRRRAPKDFQQRFLPREISVWPKLQHVNIIRMVDFFEDVRRLYMVLEFADNGDALHHIQKTGPVEEKKARNWCRQIGDAVRYLHEQDITHRDLKLENLLLDTSHNIKICDFGFVKEDTSKELSKTYCGSTSYAAPEILKGHPYDPKKADIWAMGVIVYIFVTGKMPFDETKGKHGVLEEQKKLHFPWQKFKNNVSDSCRALIMWMFTYDYPERPNIDDVMGYQWVDNGICLKKFNMEGNNGNGNGEQ